MSEIIWKIEKIAVPLYTNHNYKVVIRPTFCGFPLNVKKVNQLWNWKTLEDVKF